MSSVIATSKQTAVIGLGLTGLSVARFLARNDSTFCVFDNRDAPPALPTLQQEYPNVPVKLGPFEYDDLQHMETVVVSPGVSCKTPAIAKVKAAGGEVIGDIELFARSAKAPIVAITGSNGKTTVTTLLGEMAQAEGLRVAVGGNLGTPALDLLSDDVELYVLELSSFQLETTLKLNAKVACILNVSPDHLDRYNNMQEYWAAKQRIYWGAGAIVANKDDALTQSPIAKDRHYLTFGSGKPDIQQYGLQQTEGQWEIAKGFKGLIALSEMHIKGKHNALNAQAALAIGELLGLSMETMLQVLREFKGLPHRCQWLAMYKGIAFYNDSKGTNVGATVAAVEGLAEGKNIVLIAGGDGKGADFTPLKAVAQKHLKALITIGVDGSKIAEVCANVCETQKAERLAQALELAVHCAVSGDVVLLSPACASFDMFRNYEHRGDEFARLVEALCN